MEKHIEGAEDSMPPVVAIGTDEESIKVEVRKESVAFERTPGAIFQIGDCGRYTIVLSEEWDTYMALGKENFELVCTEDDKVVERLQLPERDITELMMEGSFMIGSRMFSLIPVDFFARVFPEVKPGKSGTPPWEVEGEGGNPSRGFRVMPKKGGTLAGMNDYVVMKGEADRLAGSRHRVEREHVEAAKKLGSEYIIVKELALFRGAEPYYFRYRVEDLQREMGDSECVVVETDGHLV